MWTESFNGEIDNQSPELYNEVFILIHRTHSLVNDGHDLWTEFDNKVPEVVKFWEDVSAKIRDVAINFNGLAEDRLNQIFRRDRYEIVRNR